MSKVEDFLTKNEEQEIVNAIRTAEKNTSGEIRVHLEKETSLAPLDRAKEVFSILQMENTQNRNAVLVYVAVKSKQFAIYGDEGINNKVAHDFWDSTKDIMQVLFASKNQKEALVQGVLKIGEQLKQFFPYNKNDKDELPNEISKL